MAPRRFLGGSTQHSFRFHFNNSWKEEKKTTLIVMSFHMCINCVRIHIYVCLNDLYIISFKSLVKWQRGFSIVRNWASTPSVTFDRSGIKMRSVLCVLVNKYKLTNGCSSSRYDADDFFIRFNVWNFLSVQS